MMLANVPATPASPVARVAAAPAAERNTSEAGAHLAHVANRPRAAEASGGIVDRIRTGLLRHVFDGARNLFAGGVRHEADSRPVHQAAASPSTLLVEAGTSSLRNAIPTLASMLQSGVDSRQEGDNLAAAFRTVGVGVRAFHKLATEDIDPGTVPESVAERMRTAAEPLRALIAPTTLIANGETERQLYDRLSRGDNAFLADPLVQGELLEYLEQVRDAAVAVAVVAGREDLATQLDALLRRDQLVSWL